MIDLFFFNTLLIYTNNNKYILIIFEYFQKLRYYILLIFENMYNILVVIMNLLLNILTVNWCLNNIKKYLINPIDKLLCNLLNIFLYIINSCIHFLKKCIQKFIIYCLILKDK